MRGGRVVGAVGGIVTVPLSTVMLRDYFVMKKNLEKQPRPVEEILSTPCACAATRWYRLVSPVMVPADPETAHTSALFAGQTLAHFYKIKNRILHEIERIIFRFADFLVGPSTLVIDKSSIPRGRLAIAVNGTHYRSPIGISAGFDKNGKLGNFFIASNIASHVEFGSVSYFPWAGNPRPRLFRLPADQAVINRMGLNNEGAEAVANRLSETIAGHSSRVRFGMNITKTPDAAIEGEAAVEDFAKSSMFMRYINGIDWITLNISCPNTAEGTTFEDPTALRALLTAVRAIDPLRKIHLKIAPLPKGGPVDNQKFEIAKEFNIDALVVANTVPDRNFDNLKTDSKILSERGGLSGRPIFERSIPVIAAAYKHGITVVGVGGVFTGSDAYRLIKSGASLVQLYTAVVFEGPGVLRDIENGLERLLFMDGYSNIAQAVGVDVV